MLSSYKSDYIPIIRNGADANGVYRPQELEQPTVLRTITMVWVILIFKINELPTTGSSIGLRDGPIVYEVILYRRAPSAHSSSLSATKVNLA